VGSSISEIHRTMAWGKVTGLEKLNAHQVFSVQHRGFLLKLSGTSRLACNLLKRYGTHLLHSSNIKQREQGRKLILLSHELKIARHIHNSKTLAAKSQRPGISIKTAQKYTRKMKTEILLYQQRAIKHTDVIKGSSLEDAQFITEKAFSRYRKQLELMMDIASGAISSPGRTKALRRAAQEINICLETMTVLSQFHPNETKDVLQKLMFYSQVCKRALTPSKGQNASGDLAGYTLVAYDAQKTMTDKRSLQQLLLDRSALMVRHAPDKLAMLQSKMSENGNRASAQLSQLHDELNHCILALQRQLYHVEQKGEHTHGLSQQKPLNAPDTRAIQGIIQRLDMEEKLKTQTRQSTLTDMIHNLRELERQAKDLLQAGYADTVTLDAETGHAAQITDADLPPPPDELQGAFIGDQEALLPDGDDMEDDLPPPPAFLDSFSEENRLSSRLTFGKLDLI